MYDNATIRRARALSESGCSDYAVAAAIGVTRQTVMHWRQRGFAEREDRSTSWTVAAPEYPYLLGLYLGDGCLSRPGRSRSHTLDLACDAGYPAIISEAERAIRVVFGERSRRWLPGDAECVHVRVTHRALVSAFPQHGPGRKHERKIELVEWQRVLTRRYPEAFIRGLIHSDGSRCINRSTPRCRADARRTTSTCATSSRITPPTSARSSATTVICWESGGRSRAIGTSRSHIATAPRFSTRSLGPRPRLERHRAGVVKLADTRALGARARKSLGVRVPPPASSQPSHLSPAPV